MNAHITLSQYGHGHFGVAMLRVAFEELIWIEYLNKNRDVADELIKILAIRSGSKSVLKLERRVGRDVMRAIGWTHQSISRNIELNAMAEKSLKELAKKLGWNRKKEIPTMNFLASAVGRYDDYDFLYHATSNYVHFSPHELFRRMWGQPGRVKIGSNTLQSIGRNLQHTGRFTYSYT